MQILLGGVVPALVGIVAGVLIGVSAGAYIAWSIVAAIGGFLAGFEHRDGWGGADRGLVGGVLYGILLLVTHAVLDNDPKVSLGSFPPFLVVITGIVGMLLSAAGGRIARAQRERSAVDAS
jgi:hypothetical protein